jgi:hypothetical protein
MAINFSVALLGALHKPTILELPMGTDRTI